MSWFQELHLSWIQRLCLNVLKQGAVPEHVAFIMDGNRRFAIKKNMQHIEGHIHGFEKLTQTLEWCVQLGIREVTVYAFSIENFKRSEDEVKGLMELAEEKLKDLLEEKEKINENGLCIRVVGDLALLPKTLQKVIGEAVLMTEKNNRLFLNVCLSYTSRHEMCSAIDDLVDGVSKGLLLPDDINESLISSSLSITSEPDLVLRTSGEVRLSDFLLWQSSYSVLGFLKVLWPEFSIWHLFLGVLFYQFSCKYVQKTKELHKHMREQQELKEDLDSSLTDPDLDTDIYSMDTKHIEGIFPTREERLLTLYKTKKNERRTSFLKYIKEKHREQIVHMKQYEIN